MELWLPNPWQLAISTAITIFIAIYLWFTRPNNFFTKRNLPFLKPSPLFGNLAPFILRQKSFGDTLADVYRSLQGSGIAGFYEFRTPLFMILDPELYKRITVKDFEYFTDRRGGIREDADPLFGRTLFALQGHRWKNMRHTLSPAFTSSKMKAMFLLVAECGKQLADYLENKCSETTDGLLTLEMKNLFTRYANDVFTTSVFGVQCNSLVEQDNEIYKAGNDLTSMGGRNGMVLMGYSICARIMKFFGITFVTTVTANFFRDLIKGSIETREREGIIRPDMIHLMRQAQKGTLKTDVTDEAIEGHEEQKQQKIVLTDDDLVAQAVLFFFGGFDTTSNLLCFLTHQLAVNPDIQERLQSEVDEVLEEDGGRVTYEGIQRMKYMDMVISETLRLYPPVVFSDRLCVKNFTLPATPTSPEVEFTAGDQVIFPVLGIHRDPKYWPEPMTFDPERFSDENKHNIVPGSWIPFGEGPRGCIGMRFALMEAKIAFASVFSRFDLQVVSQTTIPAELKRGTFNVTMEGGFWLGLKPRSNK